MPNVTCLFSFSSDSVKGEYSSCEMYDLSGIGSINRNFATAKNQRSGQLSQISCHPNLPLIDQYQFDRSENISSIVTDVSAKER